MKNIESPDGLRTTTVSPSILNLKLPFELTRDQIEAVDAWISNDMRGSIIYSSGTGKTEIAFECARKSAAIAMNKKIQSSKSSSLSSGAFSSNLSSVSSIPEYFPFQHFNIVLLVPRIVLIDQNFKRLVKYGIPAQSVGRYFGEDKQIREITISTYQSVIFNPDLIHNSHMVIFDEVHLVSDTAKIFSKIFDIVVQDPKKALLGLTATLDEKNSRYNTIVTILPPVKKYMIRDAVNDGRLARPLIIPLKVSLTEKEQELYDSCSTKIRNISNRFKRYDAKSMSLLLSKGGFVGGQAKAWFLNIRKRKALLTCAENKLSKAIELIIKKHPSKRVMVFSETLESVSKLKLKLEEKGVKSMLIDSKVNSMDRQRILSLWGTEFYPLLSVHTLEIGYDVPQVGIEIILATTSNMNQVIQRIGRVIRKYEQKFLALIYVIYVSDTKDDNILEVISRAIKSTEKERTDVGGVIELDKKGVERWQELEKEQLNQEPEIIVSEKNLKRIEKAYSIIQINSHEPVVIEKDHQQKLFLVRSNKEKNKFYDVDAMTKLCSCPDFNFRSLKCKHILAAELKASTTKSS
jgi:superfamily II DNA or RNA helicase